MFGLQPVEPDCRFRPLEMGESDLRMCQEESEVSLPQSVPLGLVQMFLPVLSQRLQHPKSKSVVRLLHLNQRTVAQLRQAVHNVTISTFGFSLWDVIVD